MTHLDPKALEALSTALDSIETGPDPDAGLQRAREIVAGLAALPQAEPVWWFWRDQGWPVFVECNNRPLNAPVDAIPLFASPTPTASREVTEEMVEAARRVYESASRHNPEVSISERIRAALTAALSQPHSEK